MFKCSFWAFLILLLLYPKFVSKYLFMLPLLSFGIDILKATESQIFFFIFVSLSKSERNECLKSWWTKNTSILWKLRFSHLYFIVNLIRLTSNTMANPDNFSNKIIFDDFVKIYFVNYTPIELDNLKINLLLIFFLKIIQKSC